MKKLIKEQLVLEGRLEDAKSFVIKDFQDALIPQSYKEGKRMPEWFQMLVDHDPSGSQKYLMWALKQIRQHVGKFHPFIITDVVLDRVIDGIVKFHELQDKLTNENINKIISWKAVSNPSEFSVEYGAPSPYFKFRYPIEKLDKVMKNPKDINSYDNFFMLWEMMNAIKQIPTRSDLKKEVLKITDDKYWLVISPLSHRASCSYGSNTRWCTTSKQDTQFNKYQSNTSSLFYFLPKTNPLKTHQDYFIEYMDVEYDLSKIALHMNFEGDLIFYDASDGEIESYDVTNLVAEVYGLESAQSFGTSVLKAEDYHKSKLDR